MPATAESPVAIRPLGQPGDLGWVVMAHGEIYAAEFGWDSRFEALVARIVTDYAEAPQAGRSAAWVAEREGRRVGCVFCVPGNDPRTATLRILLVAPAARGRALGDRLVQTAIEFAREAGYERMRLWTNDPLAAARRIYLRHGFRPIDEARHHSFGVRLVGQTYELDLLAD